MKGFILGLLSLLLFTSCAEQYNIAGNSTVSEWDGQTIYLRIMADENTQCDLDSCEVIHGRFSFFNTIDSIVMAQIILGGVSQMPIMLEEGEISVEVDHVGRRVSGSPLNNRFYKFMQKRNDLENRQWELHQKGRRMMREGKTAEKIHNTIHKRLSKLEEETEELETEFIKENIDNPLGIGCFMWLFSQYPLPVMTDQIREIIKDAPPQFLNHPFIRSYLHRAGLNQHLPLIP